MAEMPVEILLVKIIRMMQSFPFMRCESLRLLIIFTMPATVPKHWNIFSAPSTI